MSQSPQKEEASRSYKEGWRAVNELIRQGGSWSGRERNVCFQNDGGGRFSEVSFVEGLDLPGDGRGLAVLDFDHDGRQDLALTFRTAPRFALLKNAHDSGRALQIELQGRQSNRDAVGAWVTLRTSTRRLHRFVRSGSGFLSQSSRRLHFGLTPDEKVLDLEITWPSGLKQSLSHIPQSGLHRIPERQGIEPLQTRPSIAQPDSAPESESLWLRTPVPLPATISRKGPWTLLTFYGDWCPPCRKELADWKPHALPLQILDVDKTPMEIWNVFRRQLFDYREDLALPTSFLIDAKGQLVKVYRGSADARQILADMRSGLPRHTLPFAGNWLDEPGARNFTELATALAEAGHPNEAARYFALSQPDIETRINYAASLLATSQHQPAAQILRQILVDSPKNIDARANLGLSLLGLERYSAAAAEFLRVLELQPSDAAVHHWLAMARMGEGNAPAAIAEFESARALGREEAELLNFLGILYAQSGQTGKALAVFTRGVQLHPGHTGLASNLKKLKEQ